MDKLNTALSPQLLDLTISSQSGKLTPGSPYCSTQTTKKQIPVISTDHVSGYVTRRVPEKTIADRVHLHQLTKTDYKQTFKKNRLFEQLIPSLMSTTGMSQTSVLTHLLPALEFTPYLRKMNPEEMIKVSDHPSHLQTGFLLELITRIKQGYKLQDLYHLAGEQPASAHIKTNGQPQTISIGLHHFTREDLGDETFRELRDRLAPPGKTAGKDPGVILDHVQKRKAVAMAHWQRILLMVLKIQDSAIGQHIAHALNTEPGLLPATEAECTALTALIPTLKLTVHPGFTLLKPLFFWLSQHHLKGSKLSSQQLTWLQSMVTNKLYTKLPDLRRTGLQKLCIYKERLLSSGHETDNPSMQWLKKGMDKAINDATPQQLSEVVELFNTLLCDLTPSVSAENRLGIIYTLLKFRDQSLLKKLLATGSIGKDILLKMYKTQLILTYSINENVTEAIKKSKEQSVNCLIKTLQLRMAQCIIMMASTDGLSVPLEAVNKARTLIDHHNEGLQAVLPANELEQQDSDDYYDYDSDYKRSHRVPAHNPDSDASCDDNSCDDNSCDDDIDPEELHAGLRPHEPARHDSDDSYDEDSDLERSQAVIPGHNPYQQDSDDSYGEDSDSERSQAVISGHNPYLQDSDDNYGEVSDLERSQAEIAGHNPYQQDSDDSYGGDSDFGELRAALRAHKPARQDSDDSYDDDSYDDDSYDDDSDVEGFQAMQRTHGRYQHSLYDSDDSDDGERWVRFSKMECRKDRYYDIAPYGNNTISAENYLSVPDYLLTSHRAVTLDPQHLLLPRDKHFRIPSAKLEDSSRTRRIERMGRDEQKLREDFLLSTRSTDLTKPVDWLKIEVPITFLFTGSAQDKRQITYVYQVFNTEILPVIQQVARENDSTVLANSGNVQASLKRQLTISPATESVPRKARKTEASSASITELPPAERETMDVIRELLAVAETTGEPGLNLRGIITRFQGQASSQTLCSLLQQIEALLPGLPDTNMCKQLLELTAFQLFADLHPTDNLFRRLIKTLYIIQSRSRSLRFANDYYGRHANSESNKLKLQMGELFRNEWCQPDGLLGNRIRQSVKAAFRQSDRSCSYQQIMDSILESIRPSKQPSDDYPFIIDQMIRKVENRMDQRWELNSLKQQQQILTAHHQPAYQENLNREIKNLIKIASELCQQFLPEEYVSRTTPIACDASRIDSDMAMSDQINPTEDRAQLSRHYLYDQLKTLIPLIGTWLNQINDDGLITEKEAAKAGIDRLEQFANSTTSANRPIQNEDETLKQIIALSDQFHRIQQEHSQWQSTHETASIHNQWVETRNTLKKLSKIHRLTPPQELQELINAIISGPENPEISPEDRKLLDTVSALRTYYETGPVSKALFHPDIRAFNQQPEQLAQRIAEVGQRWSYRALDQHNRYRSLQYTLDYLQHEDPMYSAPDIEQQKALHRTRERHDHSMFRLRSEQEKCELHPLHEIDYLHDQPLLSTLESMAQAHTAKPSGIDTEPLSKQQQQQLQEVIESAPLEPALSAGKSLFDLIGMGANSEPLKTAASNRSRKFISRHSNFGYDLFETINLLREKNTEKIDNQRQQIERENKILVAVEKAHNKIAGKLQECKEALFNLLENRMNCEIMIEDRTYSYADALIAYDKRNDYGGLIDASSAQRQATSTLYSKGLQHSRNREIYHEDMQWLELARKCQSHHIDPETLPKILPDILRLMKLESLVPIDDIENKMADLQQQIQATEYIVAENTARVRAAVAQLEASLKPELEAQKKNTRAAELALFSKAFEHGHHLSEDRTIQRVLCQYLRENKDTASVIEEIVGDCKAQEKHVPCEYTDIIEPPWPATDERSCHWRSTDNLPFQIINVSGAFPLLESLHKEGRIFPSELLGQDDEGKPSSALIFAAAKGHDRACETLIKCLEETRYLRLYYLNQLLTANPSGDNRNLLHLIAQLAKPALLKSLLQLLNNVSNKQDLDTDYPSDCLQNRIALDREHLLKTLLTKADYEGLHPTDLLLFNVAKRIREWPEDNVQALASYSNDFLINEAKSLWITVSESLSVEQSGKSIECFMKGIDNLEGLSPVKRQAAETMLRKLMRIFRVHGPAGVHEQLMAQITRADHAIKISDQHEHSVPGGCPRIAPVARMAEN
ncbi:hypothetical protein [Salinisphaera sp. G21_0]|uniref:hypothetical protein n=1 Tax=Salinisphaera sp. G21_0 TaxID=2821094 RepID=UPI001AD96C51|nr:hypothetical protein [Salinisphaera sp. G21_0]MBO9481028.1 hypothetical protein [Salinisphaera sp. G21_0]